MELTRGEESFHNVYQITMTSALSILTFCQLYRNKTLKKEKEKTIRVSPVSLGRAEELRSRYK